MSGIKDEKFHCFKENEIEAIHKTLDGSEFGTGLRDVVVELKTTVRDLVATVKDLVKSVDKMEQFQTATRTAVEMKAKYQLNIRWLIGISITLFLGLLTIIIKYVYP